MKKNSENKEYKLSSTLAKRLVDMIENCDVHTLSRISGLLLGWNDPDVEALFKALEK